MTFGSGDAYLDGNAWDTGDTVDLLGGKRLHNRCMAKALKALLLQPKVWEQKTGCDLTLEMITKLTEGLLSIDVEALPLNSMAAHIYVNSAYPEQDGYHEAILDIVDPPLLRNVNVLWVSQGRISKVARREAVGVRVWPAESSMTTPHVSWVGTPGYAAKFFTDWNWGEKVTNSPVMGACTALRLRKLGSETCHGF